MTDDPSRTRFMVIQMIRITGLVLAILGVAILAGKIALPESAGIVLVFIGFFEVIVIPIVLARRWKSPPR